MKIYTDPRKRSYKTDYVKHIYPDSTFRRPFSWTIAELMFRPRTPNWAKRRYWESLTIASNYVAAFTPITER